MVGILGEERRKRRRNTEKGEEGKSTPSRNLTLELNEARSAQR